MTNERLTTRGPSPTDLIEEESKRILKSKLPLKEALFVFYGDKYPNIDGHIEFLSENSSTAIRLYFQLKSSKQDSDCYDCDRSFLNYCYKAYEPTFLIFVNIPEEKAYWEHITPAFIVSNLGIKDLANFSQQTKTIKFSKEKVINQNSQTLMEVCTKHYQDASLAKEYAQIAGAKGEHISGQEPIIDSIEQTISSNQQQVVDTLQQISTAKGEGRVTTFGHLKKKFSFLMSGMTDKLMLYYTFVHLLKPFYLDQRGEKKRRTLLEFLQITDSQERFLIESLVSAGFLGRVGDLIFVSQKEGAVSALNYYINKGKLNLDEITQLFSKNEN